MNRIAQALLFALALSAALLSPGAAQAQGEFRGFTVAELDQMLAPLALYPDTVLSHVLIAATYPIEVVQAARWTRENPGLRGEQAVNAVIGQDWDPSVMALVAFPEVLGRMDADLDWTQRLGDAFLIQEADVLDSIQRLRAQAYSAGHLRSTEQVQVIREREVIYIEPPRRQVVFVPVYDTRVVFGSWAWAHYPPVFWAPPPHHRSRLVVYWGPAFHVPSAFFFSSFHWSRREVVVVHHHHHYFHPRHPRPRTLVHHHHHYQGRELARHDGAQRWQHDPGHRRGVAYHPAVDDRHRQLERRAATGAAAPTTAPTRVAGTRSNQREWAAARRGENLLPPSGGQATRSTRSVTAGARTDAPARLGDSSRASGADRPQRATAASAQRSAAAAAQRSPERASLRSNDGRSSASHSARAVERQIQQRSTALRAAPPASRPTDFAPAAPGPAHDLRPAARIERQRQQRIQPAPPAVSTGARTSAPSRASHPISQSMETRSFTPAASRTLPVRPASSPQPLAGRSTSAAQGSSRSAQPSAAASAQRQAPEPRAAPHRPSGSERSAAPARSEPRAASERRPARRVD